RRPRRRASPRRACGRPAYRKSYRSMAQHIDKSSAAAKSVDREIAAVCSEDFAHAAASSQEYDRGIGEIHWLIGVLAGQLLDRRETQRLPIDDQQSRAERLMQPLQAA